MEDERLDGVLKSNSFGAGIQIQGPVLPHNPVAVGPFFSPAAVPGLATSPIPSLAFQ